MSQTYCTSPSILVPAADQLQRFERASSENPSLATHSQHRRNHSQSGRASAKAVTKAASITDLSGNLERNAPDTDLPHRPSGAQGLASSCTISREAVDEVDGGLEETRRRRLTAATRDSEADATKDYPEPTSAQSLDEPDHLQHRFSRTSATAATGGVRQAQARILNCPGTENGFSDLGYTSGMSSVFSSPSASTVSSPLSSPTRLSSHLQQKHQQQKSGASAASSCTSAFSSIPHHLHGHHSQKKPQPQRHNHQPHPSHHHNHHNHHHHIASPSSASGSKTPKKFDPRLGPSPYRQLLPIALCILSFATVFSILIVYMDTTEIRHQQFRLNMSREYELFGVAQDDPTLIAFLREIHMRKYPTHLLQVQADGSDGTTAGTAATPGSGPGGNVLPGVDQHFNFSAHPDELAPRMAYYVANLLQGRSKGAVIQSLTGSLGHLLTAPWLSATLNWAGIIVEPEPQRFFTLLKQNALRPRIQVVHAYVSPNPYPKEVPIHNEESEVRINSLLDEEISWFNSRVKCFPLYTIMLASNRVEYDLLSLGVHGHELEILQTLPFEKVQIEVISIHLLENQEDVSGYVQSLTKFLQSKSYRMQKKFGRNYFYQRIPTTTSAITIRTRKKDILLLKTP